MEDYKQFTSFDDVPLQTHIRYFSTIDGKKVFRMGGYLLNKSYVPDYIVLSSGFGDKAKSWSVQIQDTLFFKKMSFNDLKKESDTIIMALENKIKQLENIIISMGGKLPK